MPLFEINQEGLTVTVVFTYRESGFVGFFCGILIAVGVCLLFGIRLKKQFWIKNENMGKKD